LHFGEQTFKHSTNLHYIRKYFPKTVYKYLATLVSFHCLTGHVFSFFSETGRVLTTMKAGDFFGEIGILNLDGLNK
jgi:hypothetical protein